MIALRIGTRVNIEGRMVGASNVDVGSYRLPDHREATGATAWLSIPGTGTVVVGSGSEVRIGDRTFLVHEVVVGAELSECEVRLSDTGRAV